MPLQSYSLNIVKREPTFVEQVVADKNLLTHKKMLLCPGFFLPICFKYFNFNTSLWFVQTILETMMGE
jgi:hypothetical protein